MVLKRVFVLVLSVMVGMLVLGCMMVKKDGVCIYGNWLKLMEKRFDVPRNLADNISMMNKKYAFDDWVNSLGELSENDETVLAEHESWVDENISKVYWNFRDTLSDESGEQMDEYLNSEFKMRMMKILWEEYKAFA